MDAITPRFFERDPVDCARDLVGAYFHWDGSIGRIVETEAYHSVGDPACHTWNRPSARGFVAAHQAGDAYVYLNYGIHWLFNVLAKGNDACGFVLLRALEPVFPDGVDPRIAAGPGKLTRYLGIDGTVHGSEFLTSEGRGIGRGESGEVCCGGRIGISRAADFPWRFGDPRSKALSRRF